MSGRWYPSALSPSARVVSASRRTDIPALYGAWFRNRLDEGFAEYVPAGPPRRCRASLRPEDVRWFTFWTRWPRPFLPVLDEVLRRGFPVLVNLTVTGLGGTPVEPGTPPVDRALAAARDLAARLPPGAVLWRYDPVFLSDRVPPAFHLDRFPRLAEALAPHVDRVAISFVEPYGRRVKPDLRRYERETGDRVWTPEAALKADLAGKLRDRALAAGLALVTCCDPALPAALGTPPAGCSAPAWAARIWPELGQLRPPRGKPSRPGCACAEEVDIGVYDTCTLGCRYSYGSCDGATARARAGTHDPAGPCILG